MFIGEKKLQQISMLSIETLIFFPLTDKHGSNGAQVSLMLWLHAKIMWLLCCKLIICMHKLQSKAKEKKREDLNKKEKVRYMWALMPIGIQNVSKSYLTKRSGYLEVVVPPKIRGSGPTELVSLLAILSFNSPNVRLRSDLKIKCKVLPYIKNIT